MPWVSRLNGGLHRAPNISRTNLKFIDEHDQRNRKHVAFQHVDEIVQVRGFIYLLCVCDLFFWTKRLNRPNFARCALFDDMQFCWESKNIVFNEGPVKYIILHCYIPIVLSYRFHMSYIYIFTRNAKCDFWPFTVQLH